MGRNAGSSRRRAAASAEARPTEVKVIIVSRKSYADPTDRDAYVVDYGDIVEMARSADGCRDFHITADPLEEDRVNV